MINKSSISDTPLTTQMQQRVTFWKGVDVLIVSIGIVVLVIVGTVGAGLAFGRNFGVGQRRGGVMPVEFTLAVLTVEFVAIVLSVQLLGLARRKYGWADIGFVPTTRRWVAGAVSLFVVLRIAVIVIVALLAALGFTSTQAQALAPTGFSWVGAIGNTILAGVLVPIAEVWLLQSRN